GGGGGGARSRGGGGWGSGVARGRVGAGAWSPLRPAKLRLLPAVGGGRAVGRRPRRSQPLTQARNPSRQLAYRGSQPSSFLAFWFEDPRELVIWATTNSPASSRPSQAARRGGGLVPAPWARYGSHSATGAGSSSTTL